MSEIAKGKHKGKSVKGYLKDSTKVQVVVVDEKKKKKTASSFAKSSDTVSLTKREKKIKVLFQNEDYVVIDKP